MTTHENGRKPLAATLVLMAALALVTFNAPGDVGATPPKADGEACRFNKNCSGGFCVKTLSSAKFGVCCAQTGGTEASCNGIDDDCDGLVDEDSATTDATCDGIDDDCDGAVDEDFASTGTNCGVGACSGSGETICEAGEVQDTCTAGTPTSETCNQVDDDCDGATDEDFHLGGTCSVGVGACEAAGILACDGNGEATCAGAPGTPAADDTTCNGVDDDCDGQVDEDAPSTDATCDDFDDDCDGMIDDDGCCGQCAPQFCDPPVCNPQLDAHFLCTSGPAEGGCSSDSGFWRTRTDCDSCCDTRTC